MVLVVAFPANKEAAELMEPSDRAFDDPANFAEPLFIRVAMLLPTLRNVRFDPQPGQDVA